MITPVLIALLCSNTYAEDSLNDIVFEHSDKDADYQIAINEEMAEVRINNTTTLIPLKPFRQALSVNGLKVKLVSINHKNGLIVDKVFDMTDFTYTQDQLNGYIDNLHHEYASMMQGDLAIKSSCGAEQAGVFLATLGLAGCSTGVGCGIAVTALLFAIMQLDNCLR
jgi:hypothetical protein